MDYYEAYDGLDDLNDLDFEPKLESTEQIEKSGKKQGCQEFKTIQKGGKDCQQF